MFLHRYHSFTLCLLIRCIFVDETHTTIHLREVLGTEHEHHPALDITVTIQVTHGFQITLLTLSQFLFQHLELIPKQINVTVEFSDVMTNGVDGSALVGNFVVDDQQVLQSFVYIPLIGLQLQLLFLNSITHLLLLFLQTTDGRLLGRCRGLFLGGRPFLRVFLGGRLPGGLLSGSRTCLRGSCPLLLSRNRCHEAHQ